MRRTRTFWITSVTATAIALATLSSAGALGRPWSPVARETDDRGALTADGPVADGVRASATTGVRSAIDAEDSPTTADATVPPNPAESPTAAAGTDRRPDATRVDDRREQERLRLIAPTGSWERARSSICDLRCAEEQDDLA